MARGFPDFACFIPLPANPTTASAFYCRKLRIVIHRGCYLPPVAPGCAGYRPIRAYHLLWNGTRHRCIEINGSSWWGAGGRYAGHCGLPVIGLPLLMVTTMRSWLPAIFLVSFRVPSAWRSAEHPITPISTPPQYVTPRSPIKPPDISKLCMVNYNQTP